MNEEQKKEFNQRANELQIKIKALCEEAQIKMNVAMIPNIQFEDLKYKNETIKEN